MGFLRGLWGLDINDDDVQAVLGVRNKRVTRVEWLSVAELSSRIAKFLVYSQRGSPGIAEKLRRGLMRCGMQ